MDRLYEGLFLLDANEAAKSWTEVENHIGHLLGKINARMEYSERWSDKKLAYSVKGVTKGTYYLTYFRAATDRVGGLRRDAELSERILRLLITQEEWTEEEMKRRREASSARARREHEAPREAGPSDGGGSAAPPVEDEMTGDIPDLDDDGSEIASIGGREDDEE